MLISSDEALELARQEEKQRESDFRDVVYGLLDISMALLVFLPLFAKRTEDIAYACSLWSLVGVQPYIKALFFVLALGIAAFGILTLALQRCNSELWSKNAYKISLVLNAVGVLLFIICLQPYAAVFAFVLLAIKIFISLKR